MTSTVPRRGARRPRRSSSRRGAVLALAALPLLVTACGGSAESADPAGPPKPGGAATVGIDTPITGLDPNVASSAQEARILRQLYDNLVATTPEGAQVPWLATKWEISPDGKTYTFSLRNDVTFHDGTPFNAAAVCFNLDRIKNPETGSVFAIGAIGPYRSCAAPAPDTAVVALDAPYAPFLASLSSPFLGMVSPSAVGSKGKEKFRVEPVGTGPFTFESYTPNDRIALRRNDEYAWGPASAGHAGASYLERLTFQIIPDATVRMGSLRNGSIQAVGNVPETEAAAVERDTTLSFVRQRQSGAPFQLFFNTARQPWDNPEVRRAIRSGFSVDPAVRALYFGVYERAWSPLSPTTPGYDKATENSWTFNAQAARSALDALGWLPGPDGVRQRDGKRLSITYLEAAPNREKRQDIAEFFKQNMRDIGIDVDVQPQQTSTLQARIQAADYDVVGLSLVSIDADVMYKIYDSRFLPKPRGFAFNLARVADPSLDSALLAAQQEQEQASRITQYAALQKRVIDEALSIPVYVPTYTVATSADLEGLRFDAEGYPVFYDVYLDS